MRSSSAGPASRPFCSSAGFAAKVTISPGAKSFAAVSAVNPVSMSRLSILMEWSAPSPARCGGTEVTMPG